MKKSTYILFLFCITVIFSCEKDRLFVLCRDCYLEEPERATIVAKLSSYNAVTGYFSVQLNVYDGNLEDSILIESRTVTGDEWEFKAYFNKKYTFTASYGSSNNTYITVDAAFPEVRYVKDQCEQPCYYVYGNKVNLRLKYPDL